MAAGKNAVVVDIGAVAADAVAVNVFVVDFFPSCCCYCLCCCNCDC